MTFKTRLFRLVTGLVLTLAVCVLLFSLFIPQFRQWGATAEEAARSLPGDDTIEWPLVNWTVARIIHASPDVVWPWIIQMGDNRAGFYSFTFIENRVGALTGGTDYNVTYVNADRVHPEFQSPEMGTEIIQGVLQIADYLPGQYLLADSVIPEDMGWTWVWVVEPASGGTKTRLINRIRLLPAPGVEGSPVTGFMTEVGAFVMEQRMMKGIQLRAEGGREPAWIESLEIALWVATLLAGLTGGVLFILRRAWRWPLAVGMGSLAVLFILTFVQPPILVRALMLIVLLVGLWKAGTGFAREKIRLDRRG